MGLIVILFLALVVLIYYVVAKTYAEIGRNLGHPNPNMAYLLFLPFVLQIYLCQLGRVSAGKFWMVMLLVVATFGTQYVHRQALAEYETKLQAVSEQIKNEHRQKVEARVDAALSGNRSAGEAVGTNVDEIRARMNEVPKPNPQLELLNGGLGIVFLIVTMGLLISACRASLLHLAWLFIPLLGPIIILILMHRRSKTLAAEDEGGGEDWRAAYEALSDVEKKVVTQIVGAIKGNPSLGQAQFMGQLQGMGLDPERAESLYAIAYYAYEDQKPKSVTPGIGTPLPGAPTNQSGPLGQ